MVGVHFRLQPHKLPDGLTARLIFDLAHHLIVSRIIEGGALRITGEIELILLRPHVMIEVIGADFIHERVRVGEQELDVLPVFLLHHFVMEPNAVYEIGCGRILRSEKSRDIMMRLLVAYREKVYCDLLEHVKFAEFQDSEPHIEGFIDSDHHLLQIESHMVIVEDADPLNLRFVLQLLALCCVCQEADVMLLGVILTCLAVDRVIH